MSKIPIDDALQFIRPSAETVMTTEDARTDVILDKAALRVQRLAADGDGEPGAAVSHTAERLRRLEDQARCVGGTVRPSRGSCTPTAFR